MDQKEVSTGAAWRREGPLPVGIRSGVPRRRCSGGHWGRECRGAGEGMQDGRSNSRVHLLGKHRED